MRQTSPVVTDADQNGAELFDEDPKETEQSRTDRSDGTALLTGGLLVRVQPEEPQLLDTQ
jgi:hypothetical protein